MSQFSDVSISYVQELEANVLQARVFGAFISAVEHRKETDGLTRKALAEALSKDETNVSKLLSGPRNWTLSTISDLAVALNVKFHFALEDARSHNVYFLDTGTVKLNDSASDMIFLTDFGNVVLNVPKSQVNIATAGNILGQVVSTNSSITKFARALVNSAGK